MECEVLYFRLKYLLLRLKVDLKIHYTCLFKFYTKKTAKQLAVFKFTYFAASTPTYSDLSNASIN